MESIKKMAKEGKASKDRPKDKSQEKGPQEGKSPKPKETNDKSKDKEKKPKERRSKVGLGNNEIKETVSSCYKPLL